MTFISLSIYTIHSLSLEISHFLCSNRHLLKADTMTFVSLSIYIFLSLSLGISHLLLLNGHLLQADTMTFVSSFRVFWFFSTDISLGRTKVVNASVLCREFLLCTHISLYRRTVCGQSMYPFRSLSKSTPLARSQRTPFSSGFTFETDTFPTRFVCFCWTI